MLANVGLGNPISFIAKMIIALGINEVATWTVKLVC